ncbi:hypothetical protein SRHO_G00016370 [Serrasalmus rhombeus]
MSSRGAGIKGNLQVRNKTGRVRTGFEQFVVSLDLRSSLSLHGCNCLHKRRPTGNMPNDGQSSIPPQY